MGEKESEFVKAVREFGEMCGVEAESEEEKVKVLRDLTTAAKHYEWYVRRNLVFLDLLKQFSAINWRNSEDSNEGFLHNLHVALKAAAATSSTHEAAFSGFLLGFTTLLKAPMGLDDKIKTFVDTILQASGIFNPKIRAPVFVYGLSEAGFSLLPGPSIKEGEENE